MNIKNIVFDIGGVLANPKNRHWFITPNFWNIINRELVNEEKLQDSLKKHLSLQTQDPKTETDEHKMFSNYYYQVLKDIHYPVNREISDKIADDCVYNDEKFIFYNDVQNNLEELSKKYNLYIVSNGWTSSLRILENQNIEDYFQKIFISSMYSTVKEEKLFDLFLEETNIQPQETLYIDDRRHILEKASEYPFHLLLMDRKKLYTESKFKIINNMNDIWEVLK